MPRAIPYHDLLFRSVRYVVNRQLQQRPTTLIRFRQRMGYGQEHILGLFELESVEYVLVNHNENAYSQTTEIFIRKIPEHLVVELGVGNQEIEESFHKAINQVQFVENLDLPDSEIELRELVDPVAKYRIRPRVFKILEPYLIESNKLASRLAKKGVPKTFIENRLLKERLYEQLSPVWRPYYLGSQIYFLKKCTRHVRDIESYYEKTNAPRNKQYWKNKRKKRPAENYGLFSTKFI